jgi:hypothetical protein
MQSIQGPGLTECKPFVEAPDTRSMMRIGLNVLEMVIYSGASPLPGQQHIAHTVSSFGKSQERHKRASVACCEGRCSGSRGSWMPRSRLARMETR